LTLPKPPPPTLAAAAALAWGTALAVAALKLRFSALASEWLLVERKAGRFLASPAGLASLTLAVPSREALEAAAATALAAL
jgi:hypothetical protein